MKLLLQEGTLEKCARDAKTDTTCTTNMFRHTTSEVHFRRTKFMILPIYPKRDNMSACSTQVQLHCSDAWAKAPYTWENYIFLNSTKLYWFSKPASLVLHILILFNFPHIIVNCDLPLCNGCIYLANSNGIICVGDAVVDRLGSIR